MVKQHDHWLFEARCAVFETYRQQNVSTWIEACGGSMRPVIEPGTWMLVEFGALPMGIGEIIVFSNGKQLVAHRIVRQHHEQGAPVVIAKGDAEPYCDPPVRVADVFGVVRAIRYGPLGRPTTVGCIGRHTRAIARISRWKGSSARLARSISALLPKSLRCPVLRAIPPCTRIAAQMLLAPVRWLAWIKTTQLDIKERGKTI